MFEVKFRLDPASRSFLQRFPDLVKTGLRDGVRQAMLVVEREAKSSFGKPDNLKVLSGRLRSSINVDTKVLANKVIGEIGSDVVYSRIHELSGYAGPRRLIFLRERAYLAPAFEKKAGKILDVIANSIRKSVEK